MTIKDISAKCGVSVSTVSKALNGYDDIGAQTKKFVLDTAKQMGYFPNSNARALKTNKTYNIGVLLVDLTNNGLKNEYFAHILSSFQREVENQGYDITLINNTVGKSKMSYLEHCRYRNFDGVLIACVDFNNPEVLELINSDIPVVTIDHTFSNAISVISDNIDGMKQLVQYIIDQGHTDIAYIHGNKTFVTHNRIVSFNKTMAENNLEVPQDYLQEGIYRDPEVTSLAVKKLLSLKKRPTCIIMPDDYAAIGGLSTLEEFGLRVPEDISIAGYDGISVSQVITPKLTTIKQDTDNIGYKSATNLIQLIENPMATSLENLVLKSQLVRGNSIKNLNQ